MTDTPDPNSANNKALHEIDALVTKLAADPAEQMGLLIMATVLATRRFITSQTILDRGRRMRVIRAAVSNYDAKLRQFVIPKT